MNFVLKNPSNYPDSWYLYEWTDASSGCENVNNAIPDSQCDTYTQIATGQASVSGSPTTTVTTLTTPDAIKAPLSYPSSLVERPLSDPSVSVSSISSVVSGAPNSVWFVLPDFTAGQGSLTHNSASKCGGVKVALATDVYSGTYLFGALAHPPQNEVLDTNSASVSQSALSCGQPSTPTGQSLVAISGPVVSEVVHYYESTTSPLYYNFGNGCITRRDTGASIDCSVTLTPTTDVFLMEAFIDQAGRTVYIIYGRNWPGTLAGYEYLVDFVLKNPTSYTHSWYVYRWTDAASGVSANSIPDAGDTFQLIQSGP